METLIGQPFASETQAFRDCGFTSLHVVEFAQAVSAAVGVSLPVTLVYDHPTPRAVVTYLRASQRQAAPIVTGAHHDEPIASMSCRYPGGANSPEALWTLLMQERDAISEYPTDRGWDTTKLYDSEPGRFGKISTRTSGFLHDASAFDPAFFGISPREALTLEPQQRLLLEVSWEALERAGIDPASLHGSLTGVYAGIMGTEYGTQIQHASEDVTGYGGDRYRLFVLVGGHPYRCYAALPVGLGRRGHGHADPRGADRLFPAAGSGPGRPLQGLLAWACWCSNASPKRKPRGA